MKGKQHQDKDVDSDDDNTVKEPDCKDLKVNFDMKTLWKNINEKYFKSHNELNVNQINHLLNFYSKYGIFIILMLRFK